MCDKNDSLGVIVLHYDNIRGVPLLKFKVFKFWRDNMTRAKSCGRAEEILQQMKC